LPFEIEIKLQVDDLAPIRERLEKMGAQRVGEVIETNIFFDTPDRAMLAADRGVRIRRSRDTEGVAKDRIKITYKGPRGEGAVKRREEIEIAVDRLDNAISLLEQLGYSPNLTFEKRREEWKLDKCIIDLDSLPHIGKFVEIECPTQTEVVKLQEKLGLAKLDGVMKTYADLVSDHLSDVGAGTTELTFTK
jgi:adenylate cyclase class 2